MENKLEINDSGQINIDFQIINVDFEGRNILDNDFDGVKQLIDRQFLRGLQVNPTFLTNLLLSQNYVGSTLKQTVDDALEDDDSDDESDDTVFGVTSIINLKERDEFPCLRQLRQELRTLADRAGDAVLDQILRLTVDDKENQLGLLINERFTNLPQEAAKPLLTSLIDEVDRACAKGMAFNFKNVIVFSRVEEELTSSDIAGCDISGDFNPQLTYTNPEEEALMSVASLKFSQELEVNESAKLKRLVLVVPMDKFRDFVAAM